VTEVRGPTPQWVRDRHMRISTTSLGVLGAGWVLYSVAVLGAVYGFLFLPPRGWSLLGVLAALVLLLAVLIGVSELLSRKSHGQIEQQLNDLPFDVTGYADTLGALDVDSAQLALTFSEAPDPEAMETLVAKADTAWLRLEVVDETATLTIRDALGDGTNWRLNQRLTLVLQDVCVPTHESTPVTAVAISVSASSAHTSA